MPKGDIETYHTKADGKWHNKVEGPPPKTESEASTRGCAMRLPWLRLQPYSTPLPPRTSSAGTTRQGALLPWAR